MTRSGHIDRAPAADTPWSTSARFADLFPEGIDALPVAWHQVRIPAAPRRFALTAAERTDPDPLVRFRRRIIQQVLIGGVGGDHLALIDKALPHALHDLMLTELSRPTKATATEVSPTTGRMLWQTGLSFIRFVSDPTVRRTLEPGSGPGQAVLALNCDPNTRDRESVQAAKQFHLHLIYWTAAELSPLNRWCTLEQERDIRLRRQAMDPLAFLGARLLRENLAAQPLDPALCHLQPIDEASILRGQRPPGCILSLPGWEVLDDPAFEVLVRSIHRRIEAMSRQILGAFTGVERPPEDWHRHPLLAHAAIRTRLAALPLSHDTAHGLERLALALRDLSPETGDRLAGRSAACRKHLMCLNQPSYTLNLIGAPSTAGRQAAPQDGPVSMILQTKLFSGIGGAGLLALGSIPSVRIVRGQGMFSETQWQARTRFQQRFARFNEERLTAMQQRPVEANAPGGRSDASADATAVRFQPVRDFAGLPQGWTDAIAGGHRD